MQCIYNKVAKILQNDKFINMKTLIIYFSGWQLDNGKYQDMICASLMKMPKLKLFKIVVFEVISDFSFKPFGDRLKIAIDREQS